MKMISWYDSGVCTVVAEDNHSVFAVVSMLEAKKIKFKVTDRLGLIKPEHMDWGPFDYWLTRPEEPLY